MTNEAEYQPNKIQHHLKTRSVESQCEFNDLDNTTNLTNVPENIGQQISEVDDDPKLDCRRSTEYIDTQSDL